jgi:hypothetical protein
MDTTTHTRRPSDETLLRLVRQIDARPAVAWKRDEDAERLAQCLRRIPTASLRSRIGVS